MLYYIAILFKGYDKTNKQISYRGYSTNKEIIKKYIKQKHLKKRYDVTFITGDEKLLSKIQEKHYITEITEYEDGVYLSEHEADFLNEYYAEQYESDVSEALFFIKDHLKIFKNDPKVKKLIPLLNDFIDRKEGLDDDLYGRLKVATLYKLFLKSANVWEI